jgi:hypothetical protein
MHPGKLLPFVITGAVLVIGGSYMWNSSYQVKLADQRLATMSEKLSEINSSGFEIDIEVNTETGETTDFSGEKVESESMRVTVVADGTQDMRDLNNPRAIVNIEAGFTGTVASQAIANEPIKAEIRVIGKTVYVKLAAMPANPFFDLQALSGQWIRIDREEVMSQLGMELSEEMEAEIEKDELTPQQMKRLREIWVEADVFKIVSVKPREKIDGTDTYHYVVEIQKPNLINYFKKASKEFYQEEITEEEISRIEAELADIELPQGEMWIGKTDLFPRRIYVKHDIKATEDNPASGTFMFTMDLKNINKPVSILPPPVSRSISEVMEEIFAAMSEPVAVDDARGSAYYGPSLPSSSFYNPAEQFAQARDTQRSANVNAILNAIGQNKADNGGVFTCAAGPLPTDGRMITDSSWSFGYDIASCLVPEYLATMPYDPEGGPEFYWDNFSSYYTGYTVYMDAQTGQVTVGAPAAETERISVSW